MMNEIIVDNFAGGGGASTGIEIALGKSPDIAINHDPEAIRMHKVNHPDTEHYCENVWDVDPIEVCKGRSVGCAWFSPDCKHFSKAKGGKPVDKKIRGLAWIMLKWAGKVRPRVMFLENVQEFESWGPLRRGKPIKSRKGETFRKWRNQLETMGYELEIKVLDAADFGAPTNRKRIVIIARCDGEPIRWPKKTHGHRNSKAVRDGELKPHVPAAMIIDWSIIDQSIFDRKKPLAENTLKRIARGLKKFVLEDPDPFIIPDRSVEGMGQMAKDQLLTIDSKPRHELVVAFISKYYAGGYTGSGSDVRDPLPTVTSWDHNSLCKVELSSVEIANQQEEVKAFLIKYYGQSDAQSLHDPLGTITTKDRFGLVTVHGVDYQIVDIRLRMLAPHELFRGQGFPVSYVFDRDSDDRKISKKEQINKCGNTVCPPMSAAVVAANAPELSRLKIETYVEEQQLSFFN